MYRFALLLTISIGLSACANNDKKISSWEVNDVYQSTTVSPGPVSGQKMYIGPSINTMDESNTYEMFNLRSDFDNRGTRNYELQAHLSYYTPTPQMRNYDAANLMNGPANSFKVISQEAETCEARGCISKELVSIKLTDAFLKANMKEGFQLNLSSKAGVSTVLYVPPQYIQGFLKAAGNSSN